jgi:hypothetical protein
MNLLRLSYTHISEIKLSSNTFTDKMEVTVTKNTGKVAGKEVVQLYSAPSKTLTNPAQS